MKWAVGAIVLACAGLFASVAAQAPQRAAAGPGFERASIKSANRREPVDIEFFPGRFVATNVTLELLIEQAYEIDASDLIGGPEWVRNGDRYDVEGAASFSTGNSDMLRMLRVLLADRFKLQIGQETRGATAYTLTAGDVHGLSMPVTPDERPRVQTTRQGRGGAESFTTDGRNATLAMLADDLSGQLHLPVTDKTGLRASFDFKVTYTAASVQAALERDLGVQVASGAGDLDVWVIRGAVKPKTD